MLQPIQNEHELICPCGCGVVLQTIDEIIPVSYIKPLSLNLTLLGSALTKNTNYYKFTSKPSQYYEERVLRKLIGITKKYNLPERFVEETFGTLKKKNRGFRSEKEPIRQLIKILTKDENYIHINKLKKIKADYENIINH